MLFFGPRHLVWSGISNGQRNQWQIISLLLYLSKALGNNTFRYTAVLAKVSWPDKGSNANGFMLIRFLYPLKIPGCDRILLWLRPTKNYPCSRVKWEYMTHIGSGHAMLSKTNFRDQKVVRPPDISGSHSFLANVYNVLFLFLSISLKLLNTVLLNTLSQCTQLCSV